ncbi:toxin-antitoxin system YwqK family antitoxin [Flavobacterium capsici]|uniref:Toxin-antitoxin system YwqK family antitoxin n=1 Tax=Flavobacterium capsici TaxID=3075618 RepID=A0AA96J1N3_9FLAO|nr:MULTISPECIES: hypothetical protein [unclassified Flavobacterium]WNM18060.1 hypothetical protein RN608_08550 [Flavobacterium sp. PMR2A8]WNM22112.1 hypothetical protein RN605_01850 [Flavobacterium sp. PMTSA4]
MNKIFKISFLFFIIISCKEKSVIETELESIEVHPENFSKIDTTFYENKTIKSLKFINGNDYVNVQFYKSGKKEFIHPVKNRQCHNKYFDWYENGTIKWEREYNLGNQIGKSISYRSDGTLENIFDNSTNEHTTFYKNGKRKETLLFKPNSTNDQIQYYFNGKIKSRFISLGNGEHSAEYYNENGEKVFDGFWKSTLLLNHDKQKFTGNIITYFANGEISHFSNHKNGIFNGKFYDKYANGNLQFQGIYINGEAGKYEHYYENGKLHYINDPKNKIHKEWDEKGNLIK